MRANNQQGISLLEVLLVLLIAATIVAAAVTYYSQTIRSDKVSQTVNFIQQINKAGYEWLQIPGTSGDYNADFTNLNNSSNANGLNAFIELGLMTCENNSCLTNAWGGKNLVVAGSPPNIC